MQLPAKNLASLATKIVCRPKFARKINSDRRAAHAFDRTVSWPVSQILTRHTRRLTAYIVAALLPALGAAGGCGSKAPAPPGASGTAVLRGGSITTSMRTEPGSFNRLTTNDSSTVLVSALTQAKLVRVNQVSQTVEPWLAESWTSSDAGRRFTMKI